MGLNPEQFIPIPNTFNAENLKFDYLLKLEREGITELPVPDGNKLITVKPKDLLDIVESQSDREKKHEASLAGRDFGESESFGDSEVLSPGEELGAASSVTQTINSNDFSSLDEEKDNFIEINLRTRILTDQPNGPDRLNYQRYAVAFADLITNPELSTPITIGVYGEWGTGKSFLMKKIKDTINPTKDKLTWKTAKIKIVNLLEQMFNFLTWSGINGWIEKLAKKIVHLLTNEITLKDVKNWAQKSREKKTIVDIHVIEFNAWVYSGSEHLWASLVTHIYRETEKYFGFKAYILRLGKALRKSLPKALGVFVFYALIGVALSFLLDFNEIKTTWDAAQLAIASTLLGGSALASLPVLWSTLREFFDSLFLSRANKLQNLASKPNFSQQIGIMADIKDEIRFLRKLLKKGKRGKPTRLVLMIDDLDRCEHSKAVEVLQAIMLLLADEDGSPFVIFLGIDARVIIRAVEEHYGKVLVEAGINGYEYLDKIIQIPFVIPPASKEEIGEYVDSMLYASGDERDKIAEVLKRMEEINTPSVDVASDKDEVETAQVSDFPSPELPTEALLGTAQEAEPEKAPEDFVEPEEISVTFTQVERDALKACATSMVENPRKIKRIVNIYRLARLLTPTSIEPQKMINWILLTEQWPLYMAWILEVVENDFQTEKKLLSKNIVDVYSLATKHVHSEAMDPIISVDADHELFEQFIRKEPVYTVQELLTLVPLTFNLNPAIRSDVEKHAVRMNNNNGPVINRSQSRYSSQTPFRKRNT
ncbi:MAG: hypothetical protein HN560_02710 [Anaerolineae bacterium]|nr:hypothetical protein [Anaerolineae bacterium]